MKRALTAPAVLCVRLAFAAGLAIQAADAWAALSVDDDSSEAQIMGYYAAALAFTPLGATPGPDVEAGVDVGYLPPLSEEDRRTTFAGAKVEDTNFTEVLPRPRLRWRPRDRWLVEVGFFPAIEVFGVTPFQLAAAATWRFAGGGGGPAWHLRGHYLTADIEGPITCSEDAVDDPANTVCFGGQPSADHFKPIAYGVDLLVDGERLFTDALAWYAGAGYRHETLRFETHFVNVFGRLDDQELVARLDRGSAVGGVVWSAWRGLRVAGEASYAPGALFTVRAGLSWGWGTGR